MIGAVAKFVAVIALTFAIFGVAAWVFRTDLVYQFGALDQPPGGMPRTEMRVIPEFGDDPALTVWLTEPAPGQPYIVYFMGMGGALSVHEPRLRTLAEAGFGIAAMAYRGGGGQEGAPGEAALMQDARRLYAGLDTLAGREVRDTERVIYGFSFGSLIAAKLAAEQEELAVVLEAPGPDLCTMNFGGPARLPGCMIFAGNRYEAMGALSRIDAPVLVMQGDADAVVDRTEAEAVFAAIPEPKFRKVYTGGGHEDLGRFGAAKDVIAFIRTLRGER